MTAPPFPIPEIEYPSSDGKPMAETDFHVIAITNLFQALQDYYETDADIYVAANNLFYYEEGNAKARFSPDVYVVHGIEKKRRRIYKYWVEKRAPSIVFEASSRGTWREDFGKKKDRCAQLGVKEYILFDPEFDYLNPPLQGFRLSDGRYIPIEREADGGLFSETLGLKLHLSEAGLLRLIDPKTGKALPGMRDLAAQVATARAGEKKAEAQIRREARARREAELTVQREVEARKSAEAEIARLKDELKRLKR